MQTCYRTPDYSFWQLLKDKRDHESDVENITLSQNLIMATET